MFLAGAVTTASAQPKRFRPQPQYVQIREPDQAEGRRILEDFRNRGIEGDYYWEFSLRVMPKRGDEQLIPGRLWGSRNEKGPITRIALWPGVTASERRLLVQNGPKGATWGWQADKASAGVTVLGPSAWFEALGGTDLTAFDLQMPFIYWNDFIFEGVTNLRGRPAHVFLLYPPADVVAQRPALTGIRVYLDTAYTALVQFDQIGEKNRVLKTLTLLDFKKVDDHWIVKSVDLRDEETRNKTRFLVTGAAMGIDLPAKLFEPATLAETVRPPAADKIKAIAR
ncbi:MAG: outer membrane lipoprotein-sorting protein [Nibricoccus sp.]